MKKTAKPVPKSKAIDKLKLIMTGVPEAPVKGKKTAAKGKCKTCGAKC